MTKHGKNQEFRLLQETEATWKPMFHKICESYNFDQIGGIFGSRSDTFVQIVSKTRQITVLRHWRSKELVVSSDNSWMSSISKNYMERHISVVI